VTKTWQNTTVRRQDIYTTINFTDEFKNVSVTDVGVAGWAWWAWSTHT